MSTKKRILSGVQPTGDLHIGNWLGAINNWVKLQEQYETFLCVVDLHAITAEYNPLELSKNTLSTAALYIACGIDPNLCSIFVQSHIPAHSELCWILNCMTPINWMERMIQFKEKSVQQGNNVSIGLFDYPILMAADILLYDADFVPVGEDQKQHLELARDIAHKFNTDYGLNFFPLPEPVMNKNTRIMSLRDGNKKMSKSDSSSYSRILMTDSNDDIRTKIKKSKTDSMKMPNDELSLEDRPEISNLLNIFSAVSKESKELVIGKFAGKEISEFKSDLTDILIDLIEPISSEIKKLIDDKSFLNKVLQDGADKAKSISAVTISEIHDLMGLKN